MQHFTVDTRNITRDQFDALKAAAEAAGLGVDNWEWEDRAAYPLGATSSIGDNGRPNMRIGLIPGQLYETVDYQEALRRLAEAAEPSKEEEDEGKAHPHAENMRLYAEDAAETDRPWERWEMRDDDDGGWKDCHHTPQWRRDREYRRKPEPKKTPAQKAGFEVGDLGMTEGGSILSLHRDDGGRVLKWRAVHVHDDPIQPGKLFGIHVHNLTKLHNVKEA